jgi:polysaccharide export outer membrane protein
MRTGLLSCAVAALLAASAASAQERYRVQPGDRLDITVLEDPGLNRQVLVPPDGRISLPLAGTIPTEGETLDAIERRVRTNLARNFVEPPTVTVSLVALGDASAADEGDLSSFYVIGQIGSPGRYQVDEAMTLLQALAMSGGPGVFAARDRIQLRRVVDGVERVFVFDYEEVEAGLVPTADIAVRNGDVIVVPERGLFE